MPSANTAPSLGGRRFVSETRAGRAPGRYGASWDAPPGAGTSMLAEVR